MFQQLDRGAPSPLLEGRKPLALNSLLVLEQHRPTRSLSHVELRRGQPLHRTGDLIDHVYFLEGGLVAQSHALSDGKEGRVLLGAGAAVGLHAALRDAPARGEAVVLVGGPAHRISSTALVRLIETTPSLTQAALLCLSDEAAFLHQHLACCAYHVTERRLASFLLRAVELSGAGMVQLTQDELAAFLGTQRTTVTPIANQLRRAGVIGYARGVIRILDPVRLRALSCGCFAGGPP